jgi:hypothetical protein
MAAATSDRDTKARDGRDFGFPVAGATKIFAGTIVVIGATGFATKGATALNLKAIGRAKETIDNTLGANGDRTIGVERGCFRYANSAAADAIALADVGSDCYLVDDQTVAKTDGGATRSKAGKVRDVEANGVWVEF